MARSDRRSDAGLISERRHNPQAGPVPPLFLRHTRPKPQPYTGAWYIKRALVTLVVVAVVVLVLAFVALEIGRKARGL